MLLVHANTNNKEAYKHHKTLGLNLEQELKQPLTRLSTMYSTYANRLIVLSTFGGWSTNG